MVVDGGLSAGCMRNTEGGGGVYHQKKSKNKYTKIFSIAAYIFQSIHSAKRYLKCTKVHKTSFSKLTKEGIDCTNYTKFGESGGSTNYIKSYRYININLVEDWRVQYWSILRSLVTSIDRSDCHLTSPIVERCLMFSIV